MMLKLTVACSVLHQDQNTNLNQSVLIFSVKLTDVSKNQRRSMFLDHQVLYGLYKKSDFLSDIVNTVDKSSD